MDGVATLTVPETEDSMATPTVHGSPLGIVHSQLCHSDNSSCAKMCARVWSWRDKNRRTKYPCDRESRNRGCLRGEYSSRRHATFKPRVAVEVQAKFPDTGELPEVVYKKLFLTN